ncbi:Rv0361 family membrane protein [Saccharopolyspora gregorii]|uniref:Rv0361 family membrane protein n=1 Tax=Saccharopolyspora gregorii TaxID=33914 RepID=UPI0021AD1EBA|nr:hypothetical protein [Saccharopolyspora gregorii]
MTYPPQQPGPGGNQADGAATQGTQPPQQQPAFYANQHAGWPQGPITGVPAQPGQQPFPAAPGPDPFGQPQPGLQPPFGQAQLDPQFGQFQDQFGSIPPAPNWGGEFGAGSWTQQPAEPEDDGAERGRSPLVWILGGVGVLVVAGAAVGAFFLFGGGGGPGEPRPAAQELVDKVNAGDFASLGPQLCEANRAELDQQFQQLSSGRFQVELGQVTAQGDRARAKLSGDYTLGGATMPVDQTIVLTVEGDAWKICKLGQ